MHNVTPSSLSAGVKDARSFIPGFLDIFFSLLVTNPDSVSEN